MANVEVLKKLFDGNVVSVLDIFMQNPSQHYSLTQVSVLAAVKPPTTLRIIQRLGEKGFVKIVKIGKTKFYKMNESEHMNFLRNVLREEKAIAV